MRSLYLVATLLAAVTVLEAADAASTLPPAPPPTAEVASDAPAMPPAGEAADFQPYIFWAFGLSCLILLGFTLWTIAESRTLGRKVDYLTERFRHAHPGLLSGDEPPP